MASNTGEMKARATPENPRSFELLTSKQSTGLLFLAALIANLVVLMLVMMLQLMHQIKHLGESEGYKTLGHPIALVYLKPLTDDGFFGNYVTVMTGIAALLLAANLGVTLQDGMNRGRSGESALASIKFTRKVALGSVCLVAISTPLTVSAFIYNLQNELKYTSLGVILVSVPIVLAFIVGKFIAYTKDEQKSSRARAKDALDGLYRQRLTEAMAATKYKSQSGFLMLAMWLLWFIGASMTLPKPAESGFQFVYVLFMGFGAPLSAFLTERAALATRGVDAGMIRAAYWALAIIAVICIFSWLMESSATPSQWAGLGLLGTGIFSPFIFTRSRWLVVPRLCAIERLKSERKRYSNETKSYTLADGDMCSENQA